MPQLGRLSSNSLSGIIPSSGTPPPPLAQFSNLTWTTYTRPAPTGGGVFYSGGGKNTIVKIGGEVYFSTFSVSGNEAPRNSMYVLSGGSVSFYTLPAPTLVGPSYPSKMIYANGIFLVFGYSFPSVGSAGTGYKCVWKSVDQGATWVLTQYPSGGIALNSAYSFIEIAFANGLFFAFFRETVAGPAYNTYFCTSANGTTWSSPNLVAATASSSDSASFIYATVSPDQSYIIAANSLGSNYNKLLTSSPYTSSVVGPATLSATRSFSWVPELNGYLNLSNGATNGLRFLSNSNAVSGSPYVNFPSSTAAASSITTTSVAGKQTVVLMPAQNVIDPTIISYDAGTSFTTVPVPTPGSAFHYFEAFGDKVYSTGWSINTIYEGVLT